MAVDGGKIRISTELETKELEKGLDDLHNRLEKFQKDTEDDTQIETDIKPTIDENSVNDAKDIMERFTEGFTEKIKMSAISSELSGLSSSVSSLLPEVGAVAIAVVGIVTAFKTAKAMANSFKKVVGSIGNTIKGVVSGIGKIGKAMLGLVKTSLKWIGTIFGIRSATQLISQSMAIIRENNEEIGNTIDLIKSSIATALEPIVLRIVSLVYTLLSYINQLIGSLTGKDLFASARKNLEKGSKSAKEIKKQLAGFDEMNVLSDSSSGASGGATSLKMPEVDNSLLDFLDKIKLKFAELFEPFVKAWNKYGGQFVNSFQEMIGGIGRFASSVFSSMFEVWTNGTGEKIIGNSLILYSNIFDIIGGISNALKNAWDNADVGTSIIQNIADIFSTIQEFGISISDSLKKWVVSDSFQNALNVVFNVINDIIGAISEVANWVLEMWNKYVKPIVDEKILPAISDIATDLGDLWEKTIKPIVEKVWDIVKTVLEPVIDGLSQRIGGIVEVISGIVKFITGVFTGDWKKAWEGIKKIFTGMFDTMTAYIKTPINLMLSGVEKFINAIIGGLNKLIKGINKISFDVPDWVPVIGGKKWGFNIPSPKEVSLPRLAKGGIINMPNRGVMIGSAMVGESGREGVLPLTDSQAMQQLGEMIGRYITINANITNTMNGRVISRELQKINNENNFAFNR